MFWGFVLEPKKRYNTTVTKPFHISMAALDPKSINDNDISSLVLNVDGTETILCNLGKPNYLQERLDLNFIEGNTITLEVKGKAIVHLSGYFIYEQDGMDDEDDSDLDEEESVDDEELEEADQKALLALRKKMTKNNKSKFNASTTEDDSDDDDDDDDEDDSMDVSDLAFDDDDDDEDEDDEDDDGEDNEDEDDDSEDEEVKVASPGSTPMPPAKKAKGNNSSALANNNTTPISAKKKKQQEAQQAKQNLSGKKNKGDKQSPQKQAAPLTNGNTTPGSNKKKKNKENNASPNSNAGTPNNTKPEGNKTPKKSLEGGVIVEEIKVGQGVPAKSGKMVSVYYAGKLKSNNKQFDATTQGPGFKFRLGKGEVIKGWDVGLNGMRVGGKRRITIPAHMAYGNKGSPPAIPPNSTLVFDVELKNVN
uniref:FK506-binding protein n=1 Tax=Cacopsylla melanoneura TaxID=428564 RepID=A0A8D8XW03_9HEMI